ncbi:MAG TPA: type II toxin-antitoxin system VapC family toxin [Solirubrobacteraceae bacterium]|nr:type II toxin-antitoxin system VapC family toxin [Solirubrobacteraceae bacterium]
MIVVDASTLADYLLGREPALAAVAQALGPDAEQPLHAPELVWPETLNALRHMALRGHIGDDRAAQAALDLSEVRLVCYPHAPLRESVWSMRHALTAYDATYLAVALGLDDPLLLTGDGGFAARAGAVLGTDRVVVTR